MNWVTIISVISLFVVAPSIIFSFIYMGNKAKIHLKLMEAENKKYDKIIEEGSK